MSGDNALFMGEAKGLKWVNQKVLCVKNKAISAVCTGVIGYPD
jgi:hypothetical protein